MDGPEAIEGIRDAQKYDAPALWKRNCNVSFELALGVRVEGEDFGERLEAFLMSGHADVESDLSGGGECLFKWPGMEGASGGTTAAPPRDYVAHAASPTREQTTGEMLVDPPSF